MATRTAPFTRAQETRIAAIMRGVLGEFAPAPAQSAPATPKAESAFVRDVIRGRHACTASPACSRTLRTVARAGIHDDGTLGHIARSA